jgi:hypothetical protein
MNVDAHAADSFPRMTLPIVPAGEAPLDARKDTERTRKLIKGGE